MSISTQCDGVAIYLLPFVLLFGGVTHRDTLLHPKLSGLGSQLAIPVGLPNLFLLDVYKPQCYLLFALSDGPPECCELLV